MAYFVLIEEALQSRSCLSGKAYFGVDEIGLVDIALGGILVIIQTMEKVLDIVLIDTEKMPLLSAWVEQFSQTGGVKEALPDSAKYFEIVSAQSVKFASPPAADN